MAATNCVTLRCPAPHGRECHCSACHETFATPTAFEEHQLLEGGITCLDPAERGMVLRERRGIRIWGHPISEADAARLAALGRRRNAPGSPAVSAQTASEPSGVPQDTPGPENGFQGHDHPRFRRWLRPGRR
jgi:hypothetical protein